MSYSKPTVTKLGSVIAKTEGGLVWEVLEILSRRAKGGGGN